MLESDIVILSDNRELLYESDMTHQSVAKPIYVIYVGFNWANQVQNINWLICPHH